jgi:hypothetical protein
MRYLEEGPAKSICLSGTAELLAAFHSTVENYGNLSSIAIGIWDKLERMPEERFEGDTASTIVDSLGITADSSSTSVFRHSARYMLAELNGTKYSAEPEDAIKPKLEPTSPPPEEAKAGSTIEGIRVQGHVELKSFTHRVVVLAAVREFAAESVRAKYHLEEKLLSDIDQHAKSDDDPTVIGSPEAEIIDLCVRQAAARDETLLDAIAVKIVEAETESWSYDDELIAA